MSKSNVICGAKNILATSMSLMLHNYFFLTVKDQFDSNLADEKALSDLFKFDQSFKEEVDLLSSLVVKISKKNKELDSTMLDEVWDHLLKIKKRINEREKLLKGPSD